jgi:hypothetical protein
MCPTNKGKSGVAGVERDSSDWLKTGARDFVRRIYPLAVKRLNVAVPEVIAENDDEVRLVLGGRDCISVTDFAA